MIHFARDDDVVLYDGCCRSKSCCCDIGADRNECVSADSVFGSWAEKVRCGTVEALPGGLSTGTAAAISTVLSR
jgi:hypothetical protein